MRKDEIIDVAERFLEDRGELTVGLLKRPRAALAEGRMGEVVLQRCLQEVWRRARASMEG